MSASDKQAPACVYLSREPANGITSTDAITAHLGTRPGGADARDHAGAEYPHSPDEVNGLYANHGELGLRAHDYQGRLIGYEGPEYHAVHFVDAHKLADMTRTLGTVCRRLAKMRAARGYVTTWAEQVIRFAEACKAPTIAIPLDLVRRAHVYNGRNVERCMSVHAGERYVWLSAGEAASYLRDIEASYARTLSPEAEENQARHVASTSA